MCVLEIVNDRKGDGHKSEKKRECVCVNGCDGTPTRSSKWRDGQG